MISYQRYERRHLDAITDLCRAEGWSSYLDPEPTHRMLAAAGVITLVASEDDEVVGFACFQSVYGSAQVYMSLIAVDEAHRRRGIGKGLVRHGFFVTGGKWIDLVTDTAVPFYQALAHREMVGFRLYSEADLGQGAAVAGLTVRPAESSDRGRIAEILVARWSSTTIVSRGRLHRADQLPAFVAELGAQLVGLATYEVVADQAELVSLDALPSGQGIGSALLAAVAESARRARCRRLWLVTTNDNLDALRFYQRRGLRLAALHPEAISESRRLKPEIGSVGNYGIELTDELELVLPLR